MEVARFSTAGRLVRIWSLPRDAGRMAADDSGCWISANDALLHIDRKGRLHRALQAPFGDVATGAGAVWLAENDKVLRIDERTGKVRSISTRTLRLGGFQHDLAAGDGALWALNDAGRSRTALERFDLRSGRRTGRVIVPGIADALIVKPNAIWVATVIAPPNRPASGYDIIRLNPHTLRRNLLVHVD